MQTCKPGMSLRHKLSRIREDRRGVAAIEFGFMTPILLIMLIIAADLGIGILTHIELTGAARAGTQYAQVKRPVQQDFDQIEEAVKEALSETDAAALEDVTVTTTLECQCSGGTAVSCSNTCPTGEFREAFLTVQVSQDWNPLVPYPGMSWPKTLTGESIMRFQ